MNPSRSPLIFVSACVLLAICEPFTVHATVPIVKVQVPAAHPAAAAAPASTPAAYIGLHILHPFHTWLGNYEVRVRAGPIVHTPPGSSSSSSSASTAATTQTGTAGSNRATETNVGYSPKPAASSSRSTQEKASRASAGTVTSTTAAAAKARLYNTVFGTHQIGVRYQFKPEQRFIVEGAERLLAAGFTNYKFRLECDCNETVNAPSLVDKFTDPKLPNQQVLDMPFSTFFFWFAAYKGTAYDNMYNLTSYLIKRYRGTGKTFMMGTWKEDYTIRDWTGVGGPANPHPNASSPVLPQKVPVRKAAWEQLQAGVEAARRDLAAEMDGVQVYFYVEINLMKNSTVNFTIIDDVIPYTNPAPDYISISLSTLPEYILSSDPAHVSKSLHPLLDHVAEKLPAKPGIAGPRVFIGEYEFPLRNRYGVTNGDYWTTPTQELQAQHALAVLSAGIGWGVPYALWWTFYDNTKVVTKDGIDKETLGIYEDRGFGLVSHDNKDSILYIVIKEYMQLAHNWLEQQILASGGRYPCRDDFRQWAIDTLLALTDAIPGGESIERSAPPLIKRGCF